MNLDLDTVRIFLHVLAVTVCVGGQIVMLAILPAVKSIDDKEIRASIPKAFQGIAWPAMALAIFTGIWNTFAINIGDQPSSFHITFGIKFLLVIASGAGALIHSKTTDPKVKGMTGALALGAGILAMFLGYTLGA